MNMALAVTQLQFRTYVTTAFVGLMPGSALYVLVGRGIQNISAFVHGDDDNLAPVVLTVTGVVISLAVFIGLGLHARKLVQREAMGHRRDSDDAFSSVDGMLGGDGMPGSAVPGVAASGRCGPARAAAVRIFNGNLARVDAVRAAGHLRAWMGDASR